jgi:hypothetical protein
LDCVDFITNEKITASLRGALGSMPGWHAVPSKRSSEFRFAAFSTSAGESGDLMLQRFRHANNLASNRFNKLFLHRSELLAAGLKEGDRIVLVDDFSGTGDQVVTAWPLMREFLPDGPEVHLLLVAATARAIARIRADTDLLVYADVVLRDRDGVFSESCGTFTQSEKETIRAYCDRVGPRSAESYTQDGHLLVFAHTCPNNSLPILHARTDHWEGLFRRYD